MRSSPRKLLLARGGTAGERGPVGAGTCQQKPLRGTPPEDVGLGRCWGKLSPRESSRSLWSGQRPEREREAPLLQQRRRASTDLAATAPGAAPPSGPRPKRRRRAEEREPAAAGQVEGREPHPRHTSQWSAGGPGAQPARLNGQVFACFQWGSWNGRAPSWQHASGNGQILPPSRGQDFAIQNCDTRCQRSGSKRVSENSGAPLLSCLRGL